MKRVLIDARMVERIPHGIGVYVADLARSLQAIANKPYQPVFILKRSLAMELRSQSPWKDVECVLADSSFLSPSEWLELPKLLRREDAALYHSPSFASLPRCPVPWVQTVHDLNHLKYGGLFERLYYRTLLKPFVRGARSLVSISEFARNELRDWLGNPAFPVELVANVIEDRSAAIAGFSAEKVDALLSRFGVARRRYLLCVSNPKPHKNLRFLVEAYLEARRQDPKALEDFPLLLTVSSDALGVSGPGVKCVGAVSSDEVSVLMRECGVFAFPSLYEGFGRPPAEAVAMGAPVLVSDIPPHREGLAGVAASAVSFLSPDSNQSWVEAILRAAQGEIPRPSEKDAHWVTESFSLSRMGKGMDRVYRAVLGLNS